jgi:hypothetical protein
MGSRGKRKDKSICQEEERQEEERQGHRRKRGKRRMGQVGDARG